MVSDPLRVTLVEALEMVTQRNDIASLPEITKLESLDMDSLDFSELVVTLEEKLNVEIPDAVQEMISLQTTLDEVLQFLEALTGDGPAC